MRHRHRSSLLYSAGISAGLALTLQTTNASADPDIITADGYAIDVYPLTENRRCGGPPQTVFNGMLTNELVLGKYGDHAVRVVTGPGSPWGLLAIRMNVIFPQSTTPDGLTIKLFEGSSCSAGGEDAEGVETIFVAPPALVGGPGEWMLHRTIPRTADGVVYVSTIQYLLAVDPNVNEVRKVLDWSDILVMVGDDFPADQPGARLGVGGLVATPAGEIWIYAVGPRFKGLLAYDPKLDSTRILFGHDPTTATYDQLGKASVFAWDNTLQAVVLGGTYANPSERISFVPWTPGIPLLPVSRPSSFFPGILPNFNQSAWVLPVEVGHPLFGEVPIPDLDLVDLDEDGLIDAGEAALGTSPVSFDTDGDGVFDKAEASIFKTDPASMASVPPRAVPIVDYAPSTLISDWHFFDVKDPSGEDAKFSMFTRASIFRNTSRFPTPVLCVNLDCRGPDGSLVTTLPGEPDKNFSVAMSGEGYAIRGQDGSISFTSFSGSTSPVLDAVTASQIPMEAEMIAVRGGPSTHEIYFHVLSGGGAKIWRVLDGEVLVIADTVRAGCPVVASEDELARCGDPDLDIPGAYVDWAGYDMAHNALLVSVTRLLQGTPDPTTLVAVAGKSQAPVVLPGDFEGKHHAEFGLYSDPSGAFVLRSQKYTSDEMAAFPTVHRLDAALRPIDVRFPLAGDFAGGAFFNDGFFSPLTFVLPLEDSLDTQAGPVCFDEFCVEENAKGTKEILTYYYADIAALWIPRPAVPAAGEAILAATWTHEGTAGPALWRLGARGELGPWLSTTELINLVEDPADRPTLETFHDLTSLGTSPTAKEICFVEGDSKRVWRLSLTDTGPEKIERIAKDIASPVACAYTEANEVAVLAAEPSRIVIGGKTLPLDGLAAPRQLHLHDGKWLVTALQEAARCVDPQTGATTDSGVRVGTFARGPSGSLAYIDMYGYGFLSTTSDFCAGLPPIERFDTGSMNLWTRSSEGLSQRWSEASAGSLLVMQESGLAYVSALAQWALRPYSWSPEQGFTDAMGNPVDNPAHEPTDGPNGEGPPSSPRGGILRLRPAYAPVDCDIKLPGLDGARRAKAQMRPASRAASATAMAVLGGGLLAESEDWEWRGMGKPAPPACVEQGAGGSSGVGGAPPAGAGGGGGSDPDGGGCGCRVGQGEGGDTDARVLSGWALAALAVGLLRRRRSLAR